MADYLKIGQTWERKNGTRFIIDHFSRGYAYYWLANGSKPQFRSIATYRLKPPQYKLIPKSVIEDRDRALLNLCVQRLQENR